MTVRHFPVRPNLAQLKNQAKDLLGEIRRGDPSALDLLRTHRPGCGDPGSVKLADAQLTLARSYGLASWPRLVLACRMTDAIWRDDVAAVRALVGRHPSLPHEMARGTQRCNWGPPMTYAANLGRDRIIEMLHGLGATDIAWAMERATLQGRIETARMLLGMGAFRESGERPPPGALLGPAETLNGEGMALMFELGAEVGGDNAEAAMVLETYSRNPAGKHRCLELLAQRGVALPDTPPMAAHRGRIDMLEEHIRRDPEVLSRTFSHAEIFPPQLGCHADESLALHGTPLAGTTLLHICIDYDEIEIVRKLLVWGVNVNVKAAVDAEGFGGHTPLFGCVVSQAVVSGGRKDDAVARLLLDHGADPNARASLHKRLRFVADESVHDYRDVTPLAWGEQFHGREWVSAAAMRLIAERGGHV